MDHRWKHDPSPPMPRFIRVALARFRASRRTRRTTRGSRPAVSWLVRLITTGMLRDTLSMFKRFVARVAAAEIFDWTCEIVRTWLSRPVNRSVHRPERSYGPAWSR
jgi:hypothetical protein